MNSYVLALCALAFSSMTLVQAAPIKPLPYPIPSTDHSVVDNYFGTKIADPYRPLEDDLAKDTVAWVKKQNEVTDAYLKEIPYRDAIRQRLADLYNYPKYSTPAIYGDYTIFGKNEGLANQMTLYKQKKGCDQWDVLIDPNTLSDDGTISIASSSISQDNQYMAYSLSKNGSDWVKIRVRDIASSTDLEDEIIWVKNGRAAWCGEGFYYSRYDKPEGSEMSGINEYQKIYYHKLGTSQAEDTLVYEDKAHPLRYFSAQVSKDNKYIFVRAAEGTSGTEILYKERLSDQEFKVLCKGFDYNFHIAAVKGDTAYLQSSEKANGALYTINLQNGERKILIDESAHPLKAVSITDKYIFLSYLEHATSRVYQYDLEGSLVREIQLPTLGTASGFYAKEGVDTCYFSFTSFSYPSAVFSLHMDSGEVKPHFQSTVDFNPEDYTVEQVFVPSKDGTKVPLFIVYKKGMEKNGNNPLHLYSYGGFNATMTPVFITQNIMFMEQGGIYVHACLRGGGEYGETWHQAGMKEKKQNVFDDFIAAAEYLIEEKYTSSARLAISGGSNGGLLVGACLTQRPDLYAVTFPIVGVLDMLRYHLFTIGWGWAVEYGAANKEEDFKYLIQYSPLHNIKKGTNYPATMIMTADHDDRVVPAHSFKFGAALQAAQGGEAPILLRVESDAGHGAGKPMYKILDEKADMFSFMFYNMNFTPQFKK